MTKIKSNINKGRGFMKRIKERLQAHFGLTDDDIRTTIGAEGGEDIKLTSEKARERVGLSIECKDEKRLGIFAAIEQSKSNCKIGMVPTVIFKKGSLGAHLTWICVPLEHYLSLRPMVAA